MGDTGKAGAGGGGSAEVGGGGTGMGGERTGETDRCSLPENIRELWEDFP